ncbi:hypothetical protein ACQKWADRAFT_288857 [Trichoderma austrokoningii]
MASSDVRDVLNLPDGAAGGPRPSKKQKLSAPRPNLKGLAREVHNLGGDNPIAIVPEVTQFKKRRFASRKPAARWELRPFRNSGRDDASLTLRHWRRAEEGKQPLSTVGGGEGQAGENDVSGSKGDEEEIEDSLYAKYNVQVSVPQYNDDQYHQVLENPDWTKEETDYLMELVRDFDVRWPLIWDRYEWNPPATNGETDADGDESKAIVPATRSRSMEDLKARYYEVASRMMAVQKPVQYMTQPEFALHELMAHFNPQQEKLRKDFALNSFGRSREEAREEESLLLEIKRILARSDRFNEERRELYNRLDYPHAEQDINTFKSSTGLQTLLQNLMTADKSKKRKSIMGGEAPTPSGQPTPQQAAPESARRDSAAASTGPRDSAPAAAPTAGNKKAQQQQQQLQQQQQAQQAQQAQQSQLQERKKLTEQEEIIYGVTHHERLGSGPTFRTEKINKLFSHKSNQQQLRITNTLNELDVPAKLAMPTAATTHAFEQLLVSVNSLLDARKVTDKIDAEIKLELAKKAEREKAAGLHQEEAEKPEDADGDAKDDAAAADELSKEEDKQGTAEGGADLADEEKGDDEDVAPPSDEAVAQPSVEQDDDDNGDNAAADKRKDGQLDSAAPKRSASVLSDRSDKAAKRQKK